MVMSWVAPLGAAGRTERERMQISTSQGAERCYRLIDAGCEPHRELDAQYSSLDDAIADARLKSDLSSVGTKYSNITYILSISERQTMMSTFGSSAVGGVIVTLVV